MDFPPSLIANLRRRLMCALELMKTFLFFKCQVVISLMSKISQNCGAFSLSIKLSIFRSSTLSYISYIHSDVVFAEFFLIYQPFLFFQSLNPILPCPCGMGVADYHSWSKDGHVSPARPIRVSHLTSHCKRLRDGLVSQSQSRPLGKGKSLILRLLRHKPKFI